MDYQKLERVHIGVALVAAVMTGGGALYGVYAKARHEARTDTAASYETLAPEVNELKRAIEQLQEEQLRRAAERSRQGEVRAPSTQGRTPPRRARAPAPPQAPPAPASEQPSATPPAEARPEEGHTPPGGVFEEIEKKVPIDFENAREAWEKIKGIRKK